MAVYIDTALCKSCKLCISVCPKHVLEITTHVNAKGYNYVEAARQANGLSCVLSEMPCPDFVIPLQRDA